MTDSIRRSWLLIALAAAIGAVAAVGVNHIGGPQAGAQASDVELSRQQLLINQRISQAAVRRSNTALERMPRWAVVIADGRLVRGAGVRSVNRTGLGTYLVGFDRDLSECAFTASQIQSDPALLGPVGMRVEGSPLSVLEVNTATPGGEPADRNFTVQVTC